MASLGRRRTGHTAVRARSMGCCLERVAILRRRGVGGYRCIVGFAAIRTAMGLCLGVIRRHALRSGRRWLSSRKGSTAAPAQAACGDRAILRVVVAFGVRRAARTARRFLFKGYVISISIPPRERLGAERSYDAGELISELLEDRSSHGSLGSSVFAAWSLGLQGSGRENREAVVLRSL